VPVPVSVLASSPAGEMTVAAMSRISSVVIVSFSLDSTLRCPGTNWALSERVPERPLLRQRRFGTGAGTCCSSRSAFAPRPCTMLMLLLWELLCLHIQERGVAWPGVQILDTYARTGLPSWRNNGSVGSRRGF
jgi:hypothetical protein